MINYEFLYSLLAAPSPSGYENAAVDVFSHECMKNGLVFEFGDTIGNCAYSVGNENGIPFMLSGHIDEIALQVQHVDENGFVYFIKDGGVDPKVLPGSRVRIISKSGKIVRGVIGKAPIHIEFHTEAKDKVTKVSDLKIDIGAESFKEALDMIRIGDPIVFEHPYATLGEHRIMSGSIDDKVGVYIVSEVMKRLAKDQGTRHALQNLKVYGVACTQEEVGGHGATIAAKRIDPKYSIDYDVTFATDDDCVSKKEWGDIKLGKGGCIAYGPDKDAAMCKLMTEVCETNKIPYQPFSVGAGMTNTLKIKLASSDCVTMLLSIPQRNMHTPVEVCDARDIESLIDMTYKYILVLDERLGKK